MSPKPHVMILNHFYAASASTAFLPTVCTRTRWRLLWLAWLSVALGQSGSRDALQSITTCCNAPTFLHCVRAGEIPDRASRWPHSMDPFIADTRTSPTIRSCSARSRTVRFPPVHLHLSSQFATVRSSSTHFLRYLVQMKDFFRYALSYFTLNIDALNCGQGEATFLTDFSTILKVAINAFHHHRSRQRAFCCDKSI